MSYSDLEKLLDEYNWDDGFEIATEILDNPYCDLALALKVIYLADGFAYLDGFAEKSELNEWKQFLFITIFWATSIKKAADGMRYHLLKFKSINSGKNKYRKSF